MARIGLPVLEEIDRDTKRVVPCMHSVGMPLAPGQTDVPWPCNEEKYIVHFPETREIWSYGSGYGGNALLGKKCFGLRIASNMARDEGWMAEHMLILGVEDPHGEKTYVAAAFPSACGKTNLAMLVPPEGHEGLEGLDGRRRHRLDQAGCRAGACARSIPRPACSASRRARRCKTNPNAMATIARNTIFTNVALTPEGGVWWEGMTAAAARRVPRLARASLDAGDRARRRAPRRRIRTRGSRRRSSQCPIIDSGFDDPQGVPISAIIFGGRRATTHAARLSVVQLDVGRVHGRDDGIGDDGGGRRRASARCGAIRWRCCPSAAITWATTSATGSRCSGRSARRRRSSTSTGSARTTEGKFLWPGFGENMRVLQWIVDRVRGRVPTRESAIGWMPRYEDIDWRGLDFSEAEFEKLQAVDRRAVAHAK